MRGRLLHAGWPLLTNDVHYLQYIPSRAGGGVPDLPAPRFEPCPFSNNSTNTSDTNINTNTNTNSSSQPLCKSLSPFPQTGDDVAPSPPPAAPTSDDSSNGDYEDSLYDSFEDCSPELEALPYTEYGLYQLRYYRSVNSEYAKSMKVSIVSRVSPFYYSSTFAPTGGS